MIWLYKHLNNKTIVDILMPSCLIYFGLGFEFLCFIFIVEKDKSKVLKFDMRYFLNFKISGTFF